MGYSVMEATRSVTPVARVKGITLPNVIGAVVANDIDSPVPTADITVAGVLPSWIGRGDSVQVEFASRLFTGEVKRRRPALGQYVLQCVGKTQRLWQPFKTAAWVFANVSAQAAVEEILDDVGVTERVIDMEAWTIGTVKPVLLDLANPGEAIQAIIEVDGHRMFELPSGALVIRKLLAAPAPTAFRTYTTSGSPPWVLDISSDEDVDQVKKKVYVSGAVLDGFDSEGNAKPIQIKGQPAVTDSNDLVAGDPELYSMNYRSELLQDVPKATAVAVRLLDKQHRILESIPFRVPLDPDIRLCQTIGITDPNITGKVGRWFVKSYRHVYDAEAGTCDTELQLMGGDQSGTTIKLMPLADFIVKMEKELIGTTLQVLVTCLSTSQDLDGTIVDYKWTDDYVPPNLQQGADLNTVNFVYDPAVKADVTITLEVTDNDGLKGSISQTVNIGPGASGDMFVPTISAAIYNRATFTPDGGWTWTDQGPLSGNLISTAAAEYGGPDDLGVLLFGTDSGKIYRSIDRLATSPTLVYTEPAGSPINHLWWDSNQQNVVWACTQNGRLYRSIGGAGGTWELYHDFGGTYPLNRIATPPGPPVVFVFGGRADLPGTLIQWNWIDNANDWHCPDMSSFTPSAAGDSVAEAAANVFPELAIIFKGTREPAIMYAADLYAWPVVWQNAVGLDAGLRQGRLICPNGGAIGQMGTAGDFLAAFDTKEMWVSTDGVNWTTSRARLSTPTAPTLAPIAGSLASGTYSYRVSAINDLGQTLASPNTTIVLVGPAGVRVSWVSVVGATGYKVYGRTAGSELLMATVGAVNQWDDLGSVVPSGALPTQNTTAWVLPGTAANKPWHAMNVQGHPNLFFGASIEGIWKTTDKGNTAGFLRPAAGISTWPGGAIGRMISFVAQSAEASQEPDEIWLIVGMASGHKNLCKLAGTSWEIIKQDIGDDAWRLQWHGQVLFFQNEGNSLAHGSLMRSVDFGLTFTPVLDYCSAFTRGPDGTFWACTRGDAGTDYATDLYIWSSPTGEFGTWTQRYHRSGSNLVPFNSISVNPNNALQVAAVRGVSVVDNHCVLTLDGGGNFVEQHIPSNWGADVADLWVLWGQNNRLILTHHQKVRISVSDDFSVSWTQKHEAPADTLHAQNFIRCGMWAFLLTYNQSDGQDDLCLIRSSNNGEAWEAIWLNTEETKHALAYNPDGERLFIFYSSFGDSPYPAPVARMKPATAAKADLEASWTVMEYDWKTKIGVIGWWPQGALAVKLT